MRAQFEMNVGLARLKDIITALPANSSHWNEAQNRFQFIDRLLTECLGWSKPEMGVEHPDGAGGRVDYELGVPPKAVLEAKREAVVFVTLPTGSPSIVRKLAPLLAASKEFKDAAAQVVTYCALRGAQIAIVSNGPQLVVFQAIIPGLPPLEGECFMFNGFESQIEHFPLLWTLLSPEGVTENRAYRDLALHRNPRIPAKASTAIPEPSKFRYRSDLQENLRGLSSRLLEEIEDNPKLKSAFYRDCYVPIEANNRHLLLSKNIIASRYKRAGDSGIVPTPLSAKDMMNDGGDSLSDGAAIMSVIGSRPIVVIGDVGVGKTSFFENLFESLGGTESSDSYFIHIDLGIKANLTETIKEYVLDEIPRVLKTKYGIDIEELDFVTAIYHQDLIGFDKSVKGSRKSSNPEAYENDRIDFLVERVEKRDHHLHASLGHLAKGRRKQIILILDNADQRTFAIQQEAFLIAQELAATRNLLVFVALRPSTFYLSKASGALSGYQNRLLTISPPPADEVIEKRLTFAVRIAEGQIEPGFLEGIELHFGNVVAFLKATLRAIRESESIRLFLSNITGGNTRAVIELITSFCGSPNVDSNKIVQVELEGGKYKVPLHEFSKHALLGEYAYFNAQSSLVAYNVFDVNSADPREHFVASLLVAFLSSNLGVRDNDGFVSGAAILNEMQKFGFIEDQTRHALRRLAAKRLIETPHAHYREITVPDKEMPDTFYFRSTSVGLYHIKFWAGSFAFLDATSTDTPIFDNSVRDIVMKRAASFDIQDRYERATSFRSYLENQWHFSNISATFFDFSQLLKSNEDGFDAVKKFIERRKF